MALNAWTGGLRVIDFRDRRECGRHNMARGTCVASGRVCRALTKCQGIVMTGFTRRTGLRVIELHDRLPPAGEFRMTYLTLIARAQSLIVLAGFAARIATVMTGDTIVDEVCVINCCGDPFRRRMTQSAVFGCRDVV